MDGITMLILCLAPGALLGVILASSEKILDVLYNRCEPLRLWIDKNVNLMKEWQEDDE